MVWTMRGPATTQASVPKGRGKEIWAQDRARGRRKEGNPPIPLTRAFRASRAPGIHLPLPFKRLPRRLRHKG